MVDYKNILTGVAERLSSLREERPSAGTSAQRSAQRNPIVHFDEQSLLLRKCSGEAFFCRTDPTGLTAFCAIVLVVCRKYCTFAGEGECDRDIPCRTRKGTKNDDKKASNTTI